MELWRALATPGPYADSSSRAMALDAFGNVYVAAVNSSGGYHFLTIKYDANGVEQWRAAANEASDYYANAAIVVDGNGNVYVTGKSVNGSNTNFVTLKYDTSGIELWRTHYRFGHDYESYAIALAPGGIYVGGESVDPTGPPYMFVQKIVEGVLPSTTSVTSLQAIAIAGQPVSFSALVDGYSVSGSVRFLDGQTTLPGCEAVALSSALATCATAIATSGTHSITASYLGDNNNAPSASVPVSQIVLPATTTTLASSINPAILGQTITFTAVISSIAATGSVDFRDGPATICPSVALAKTRTGKAAACTTAALSVGSHAITSAYSGDSNFGGSASAPLTQVVALAPPGVTLKSSQNPSAPKASVTFTATVTGQAPAGTVKFKDGANTMCLSSPLQGGGNSPSATCASPPLSKGAHSITAQYSGDPNNPAATSPVLMQSVKRVR